jgi:methanesulfonate monooxygenase large subunit
MLECRGLGRKTDTPEERSQRIRQHNQVWGPSGRNLPEDIWAVETQWQNIVTGASRYSIIAREEDWGPMDDATLRSFYDAWGRRIGCHAHDIDAPWPAEVPSDSQP